MRRLVPIAAFCLAGLLSCAVHASGGFVLVQIASFSCPRCQRFDANGFSEVRQAVKRAGGTYDFAPLPEHGEANIWPSRIYYAARLIPGEAGAVRKAMFQGAEANLKFKSGPRVVAWLEQQAPGVYWGRFVQAVVARHLGMPGVGRAAALYAKFGGGEFPVFIVLQNGKSSLVARGGSVSSLTNKVLQWVADQSS